MNIVFAGTPGFAARHLEALIDSEHQVVAVITQPDKPGKRGNQLVPSPVKRLAQTVNLPLLQPEKLSPADLKAYPAEAMIVVAYGQILGGPLLEWFPAGCINVHASLLPAWRGAAPIQRALLAGDTQTGITIIQLDAGIDTGDMLVAEEIPIAPDDTSRSLQGRLADLGVRLLLKVLPQLPGGQVKARPQPAAGATYAHKIMPQEALLDWEAAPQHIDRQIRAFNPTPMAYAYLEQSNAQQQKADPLRVRIHRAVLKDWVHNKTPGEVLSVTGQGCAVALNVGALLITGIQLPIGKGGVLTGRELLNARKDLIYPGACFVKQGALHPSPQLKSP